MLENVKTGAECKRNKQEISWKHHEYYKGRQHRLELQMISLFHPLSMVITLSLTLENNLGLTK